MFFGGNVLLLLRILLLLDCHARKDPKESERRFWLKNGFLLCLCSCCGLCVLPCVVLLPCPLFYLTLFSSRLLSCLLPCLVFLSCVSVSGLSLVLFASVSSLVYGAAVCLCVCLPVVLSAAFFARVRVCVWSCHVSVSGLVCVAVSGLFWSCLVLSWFVSDLIWSCRLSSCTVMEMMLRPPLRLCRSVVSRHSGAPLSVFPP
jgi:hypothetical protein